VQLKSGSPRSLVLTMEHVFCVYHDVQIGGPAATVEGCLAREFNVRPTCPRMKPRWTFRQTACVPRVHVSRSACSRFDCVYFLACHLGAP
jgi:hypothetical protein